MSDSQTFAGHILPFGELSHEQFERLCFLLLRKEGFEVRHTGGSGDRGVDLIAEREGEIVFVQCKRVREFGPKKAGAAVQKILDLQETVPSQILLAVGRELTEDARVAAQERAGAVPCRTWDAWELDARVKEHPEVKAEFFRTLEEPTRIFMAPRLNPYFTGREDELKELRRRLTTGRRAALSQAISGLGGIGKTQAAIAYCHHKESESYSHVFWVNADSETSLDEGYIYIVKRLELGDGLDPEASRHAVLQWLATNENWLLVFDNADKPSQLSDYLPNQQGGHVLVTTRARRVPGFAPALSLGVMPEEEAVEMLDSRLGRVFTSAERETARELAEYLGHLPLALEQASAYMAAKGVSLMGYLKDFRSRKSTRLKDQPEEGGYRATIASTWKLNFEEVEKASVPAGDVLRVSAFWAADGIPKELLVEGGSALGPRFLEYINGVDADSAESAVGELLEPLRRFSLIEDISDAFTFSVHRLVQEVIRNELKDEASLWSQRAIESLDSVFPQGAHNSEYWPASYRYIPHVEVLARLQVPDTEAVARLFFEAGAFSATIGWLDLALSFQSRSLEINLRTRGKEDLQTLSSMSNLAVTFKARGEFQKAMELHRQALEIRESILGPEHRDTLASVNNLAITLEDLGDFDGAQEFQARALEICQRSLGDEHPDTLISMNNLATTLSQQGNQSEARELHEKTLDIRERKLGQQHPDTLTSMSNLALVLSYQGNLEKARELNERTLKYRRRILGEQHPDTLASMNNLALNFRAQEKPHEAQKLDSKVLEVRLRTLGKDHPDTYFSMYNLAITFVALGRHQEARKLFEEALWGQNRILGEEHPSTLETMNNLAIALLDLGETSEAKALHARQHEITKRAFGQDHPKTLEPLINLASTLINARKPKEAQELLEQALPAAIENFGEEFLLVIYAQMILDSLD